MKGDKTTALTVIIVFSLPIVAPVASVVIWLLYHEVATLFITLSILNFIVLWAFYQTVVDERMWHLYIYVPLLILYSTIAYYMHTSSWPPPVNPFIRLLLYMLFYLPPYFEATLFFYYFFVATLWITVDLTVSLILHRRNLRRWGIN